MIIKRPKSLSGSSQQFTDTGDIRWEVGPDGARAYLVEQPTSINTTTFVNQQEDGTIPALIKSFSGTSIICDLYRDGVGGTVQTGDSDITVKCPHTINANNKLVGLYIWVKSRYNSGTGQVEYYCTDISKVVDFGTITDADAIDLAPEIAINDGYLQVRCKKIRFKIDDSTTPPQLKIFKTTVDGAWSTGIQVGTC